MQVEVPLTSPSRATVQVLEPPTAPKRPRLLVFLLLRYYYSALPCVFNHDCHLSSHMAMVRNSSLGGHGNSIGAPSSITFFVIEVIVAVLAGLLVCAPADG